MSDLNRRHFLKTAGGAVVAGAAGAAVGTGACAAPAARSAPELPGATLGALAEVVLPGELGAEGTARTVRDFQVWLAGYRPAAEVTHGYGTGEIDYTAAHPGPGWAAQIEALDLEAQQRFGSAFTALSKERRTGLIRSQLARERGDRLPDPADARHVALGLLAFWAQTPEATNLCYKARIDPNACRPLAEQAREPAPLAGS